MNWQHGILGFALAAIVSTPAWADGRSAAHNLFTNLTRAQASLSVNEANAQVGPTLVRGVYVLMNQQGRFVGFTNEAGTLFGDSRGFNVVSPNGAQPRPLALDETNDLRAEVMSAIDYDKLPKMVYGNGGGRSLLLFSAIDCPYCKKAEEGLQKSSGRIDTTLYVVPSSLQKIAEGGLQQWQIVSRIWCGNDPAVAWHAYWSSHTVPPVRSCPFSDPRAAEAAAEFLRGILQAVGARGSGVPAFVREDGQNLQANPSLATLGPAGVPQPSSKPSRWLTASADDSFQTQPVGGQPQQPRQTKFGIQDLKKLFK
jgi:hypothetical protein